MASSAEDVEYTPLLQKSNHDNQPSFSIIRARIVSVVIPVLALSAGTARDTLMAQYIVSKLTAERGLAKNETDKAPCNVELNDSRAHEADLVEAETSELLTNLSFAMCGPAFIICVLVGSYSDFVGRRLVLVMSVLAYLLRMVITAVIVKFDLDLDYLYLAYGIEGIGGSWFVMLVGLYSLTADINTTKHDRTFWINFISCATTLVSAGANVTVGYFIVYVGYFYAFLLLLSMVCVAFVVVVFILPETLPVHRRPKAIGKNPLLYVRRVASFYVFDGPLRRRATFIVCLFVFAIGVATEINLGSMDALYQLRRPFCWVSSQIGNYVAIRNAGTAFFGTVLFKLMQCCIAEERLGMLAILSMGAALTFEAFIQVDWHFYFAQSHTQHTKHIHDNNPTQNPKVDNPTQNPNVDNPTQNPKVDNPTQNPKNLKVDNPTQNPNVDNPTQNPKVDNPTQNPKVDNPTQNPKVDNPTQNPKVDNPTQNPKVDNPTQNPKVDNPTQNPKVDYPTQNPKVDYPTQNPKVDNPTQNPKVDNPTQNPKVDNPTQNPNVDNPTHNPKVDNPTQNPNVDDTTQNPKVDNPTQNPKVDNPTQNPKVDNPTQNPNVDNPNQNPKVDNPTQNPKVDNPTQNPKVDIPVILIPETPFCPIVRSLMSMMAGPDKQGAVFASIAIVETLSQLVSTTAFNKIFAATVSYMPGAVYLVMASCAYLAFILFGVYFCVREPQSREHVLIVNYDPEREKLPLASP
ncbi:hypothetical protein Btru_042053 [Bulinus truncatus]|nr:hypothetical protein Btru_042053 [Bulinus truncatus]